MLRRGRSSHCWTTACSVRRCDAQKARVASLQAQVLDWQAEQKSVEADLRRADTMRADKIISQESWEHVKYKLDETVAEVARHRADETVAEDELKPPTCSWKNRESSLPLRA